MNNDTISIIIPVYNTVEYLDRCLESVVNQTYTDLEIICVDDGSTDGSAELLDEWSIKDNRIKVIHKENGGVSSARNVGLEHVTGSYVGWADSDDWVERDYIEKMYSSLCKYNADAALAINDSSVCSELSCEKQLNGNAILKSFMNHVLPRTLWATLIRRHFYINKSFVDLQISEDSVMLSHIYEECTNVVVQYNRGYHYEIRKESSVHQFELNKYKKWFNTVRDQNNYFRNTYPFLKPYCSYHMIYSSSLIYHTIKSNRISKGITKQFYIEMKKEIIRSIVYLPWFDLTKQQYLEIGSAIKFLIMG